MSKANWPIRPTAISNAAKGLQKLGLSIRGVRVYPDKGTFEILTGEPEAPDPTRDAPSDEWKVAR
jgi:hypothetical protein